MSKLDVLLKQFCPEGVVFKTLGEIAVDIYRGSGITKDQITDSGIPCVRYGEIYTKYGVWFDKCVSHTTEAEIPNRKYFEHGDILFAITGESVEDIAKSCAYVGHEKCLAGGDIVVLKHKENPKFLAYALSTTMAQLQKSKGKVKSKVVHSNVPSIKSIQVPVPPIPVQDEVVRILDSFTELTAELTARRQQYEYYCDLLLTFNIKPESSSDIHTELGSACKYVDWVLLKDIAEISTGSSNTNEETEDGAYPFFVRSPEVRRKNTFEFDETAIITAGDGDVGKVFHFIEGKYALHQRAYRIHIKEQSVMPKFLFYYMKNSFLSYIQRIACHSSVASLRRPMLDKFPVPVPSLQEQQRIVNILDRFDALCNDLTAGLPAEIAARQKQYAYYRDKLLTFRQAAQA